MVTISGLANQGLDALWDVVLDHRRKLTATGEIAARRREQDVKWMWAMVHERLHQRLNRQRRGCAGRPPRPSAPSRR